MMANITICDRCKKPSVDSSKIKPVNIIGRNVIYISAGLKEKRIKKFDLCQDCLKSLKTWFDNPDDQFSGFISLVDAIDEKTLNAKNILGGNKK